MSTTIIWTAAIGVLLVLVGRCGFDMDEACQKKGGVLVRGVFGFECVKRP